MTTIDWKRVNERLRCPTCGDKAHIAPETDGTEGEHTHRFLVSREWAQRLSQLTTEEVEKRITELETELASLRKVSTQ